MEWFNITRRGLLKGASALGLTAGVAAAMAPRFSLAQDGKVLRVRAYSDIQIIDPAFTLAAPEGDVMRCIFSKLVEYPAGETWGWKKNAAAEIEQVDPTHVKFTLRPGIMFTNGFGEMTAEDVKYSYERIADPATESPYKDDFAVLDHVEVTDTYSGVIVLKEPFAPLWTSSLPNGSGCILSKKAMESVGGKFETEPPATAGPYKIKQWLPKQKLILERDPDWNGEPGGFETIEILPIEDEKTAEIAFEAGELDFTVVSVGSIPQYETSPPPGAALIRRPSLAYVWLGMNVDAEPFTDPKVRRAVQHAIDVGATVEAAYMGVAERSTGIIAPGLPGHREKTLYQDEPDLEKARALLAEAGYPDGFSCTLDILNKTERLTAAQIIQANLAEIGIQVEIQQRDSGTFWTLGMESEGDQWKNVQLLLSRFSMAPDPSWATAWFTPEQVGVWNWERFNNAEFGELHKKALVETDTAKRDAMYQRMQDLMEESGAYVFLTHEATGVIYSTAIVPALQPDATVILPEFRPA